MPPQQRAHRLGERFGAGHPGQQRGRRSVGNARARHHFVRTRTPGECVVLVDSVSLRLEPGEVLGLVGESGSGKSVTMLAVLGLLTDPLTAFSARGSMRACQISAKSPRAQAACGGFCEQLRSAGGRRAAQRAQRRRPPPS
ncbi:ATP-binding cassette domain-containing protein [Nocardia camponoti]|uniref:ATP-binding cassette domain-containing protein n=1 Tax=Nocardia camponoti TaxID=1616106 RepID=UPI001668C698